MTAWLPLLSAVASLGLIVAQWWLSTAPVRKLKRKREINATIHKEIASADAVAVLERIRRLRAEANS